MATLTILPQAFIDGYQVLWEHPPSSHLITVSVTLPMNDDWLAMRTFSAAATNPERALADLRELVELAQAGISVGLMNPSKH